MEKWRHYSLRDRGYSLLSRSDKYFREFHRSARQKHGLVISLENGMGGNVGEIKK